MTRFPNNRPKEPPRSSAGKNRVRRRHGRNVRFSSRRKDRTRRRPRLPFRIFCKTCACLSFRRIADFAYRKICLVFMKKKSSAYAKKTHDCASLGRRRPRFQGRAKRKRSTWKTAGAENSVFRRKRFAEKGREASSLPPFSGFAHREIARVRPRDAKSPLARFAFNVFQA